MQPAFALVALTCAVPLQQAGAVTFDFATLADTAGEGSWNTQIAGGVYTVGGIGVTASATGNTDQYSRAYLDGSSGMPRPAGLGVCGTSTTCAGTNDDNVGRTGDAAGAAAETLSQQR